jgi:colanic acid biosynthesis glycosyl transferase WcaI
MKIAFISQYFFPEQFSNNEIVKHLSQSGGHEVHVITGVPNYPAGEFFEGYSNTENRETTYEGARLSRAYTFARGTRAIQLLLNYITFPITASWLVLCKLKKRPDVSMVSMPSPLLQALVGIFLKWRHQTPVVYWVQDIWPESAIYTLKLKSPLIVKPLDWICGWIYRRADLILVQSAAFPPMIERFGVKQDKIKIFPNTAPEAYKPLSAEAGTDIANMMPQTGFNLMFAGNIGESQDFDTYLEAAALLRHRSDLNWVIIGSGRDMVRVQEKAEARGLSHIFHFLGRHPEGLMPEFFAHADAMLVGLRDNPIFRLTVPYKVQCYMACGKPIVASLNGEGARIIEEAKAGLTAPAQSPQKLAHTIEEMLGMSDTQRAKYGENSLAYFQAHYSAGKVYGDLSRWLSEVKIQ